MLKDVLPSQAIPSWAVTRYFGAAKDLPGVRELFETEIIPDAPRKTRTGWPALTLHESLPAMLVCTGRQGSENSMPAASASYLRRNRSRNRCEIHSFCCKLSHVEILVAGSSCFSISNRITMAGGMKRMACCSWRTAQYDKRRAPASQSFVFRLLHSVQPKTPFHVCSLLTTLPCEEKIAEEEADTWLARH